MFWVHAIMWSYQQYCRWVVMYVVIPCHYVKLPATLSVSRYKCYEFFLLCEATINIVGECLCMLWNHAIMRSYQQYCRWVFMYVVIPYHYVKLPATLSVSDYKCYEFFLLCEATSNIVSECLCMLWNHAIIWSYQLHCLWVVMYVVKPYHYVKLPATLSESGYVCCETMPHHYVVIPIVDKMLVSGYKCCGHYSMTWLGITRILYHRILQCRSPQCRDLPSVAMSIFLLVTSMMVSWQHQHNDITELLVTSQ